MKNSHIAFIGHPFPAYVNPTLPLVSTLARRGHRVSYVTTDSFAPKIMALGAEIITFPPILIENYGDIAADDLTIEALEKAYFSVIDSLPRLVSFYESHRPDLILHSNWAIEGRIVATRLGIPRIQFYSNFATDKDNLFRQIRDATWRRKISDESRIIDRFLQKHGVISNDFSFERGKLSVYFFPKVLQPLGNIFGTDCIFAGRCAGEQSYHENWQRQNTEGRPVVLVSTSTMFVRGPEYFKMCIDALSQLQLHVLLSIGNNARPDWYTRLPPHFEIVQGIPHAQILPHVDLFIFLSGTISTSEAMYHGVPMLVLSHGFKELEFQGDIIDSLGIGIHLRKADMSVTTIRDFANQILSDSALLKRVREFQNIVRRDPGSEEVANRIEEYMLEVAT